VLWLGGNCWPIDFGPIWCLAEQFLHLAEQNLSWEKQVFSDISTPESWITTKLKFINLLIKRYLRIYKSGCFVKNCARRI